MIFKKVNIWIVCIAIIILLFTTLIVYTISVVNSDDNQIKIAIYPSSGGLSHTYYFVIDLDTGKMMVEYGTRCREEIDFTQNQFLVSGRRFEIKKEKIQLSSNEIYKIINLLDLIFADEKSDYRSMVTDGWGIAIYYNKSIIQNNAYVLSDRLKELIDFLRDKTSIEMKLQGFA